jgi:hypothetical protein
VKTTLFAATLVVALTLTATAAQKKPPMSQHLAGNNHMGPPANNVPPLLCNPCLFYGGDLDPSNINAAGLSTEDTILIPGSATYGNFNVPSTTNSVTVTGVLFQVQADANFDPTTASYDIRSGVSEGNGGTSLASGSGTIQVAATGRNFLGLNEFTVAVQLSTPLVLSPGAYWANVTPTCTNGAQDGSCSVGRFFVSNVTGPINNIRSWTETNKEMFFNSSFFGFNWANWCDSSLGLNGVQCGHLSFGIMGTINP